MEKVIVIPQCRKYIEAQTLREKDCVLRALHYAMDGIKRVKTATERSDTEELGGVSITLQAIQDGWAGLHDKGKLNADQADALTALYTGYARLNCNDAVKAHESFTRARESARKSGGEGADKHLQCLAGAALTLALCQERRFDTALEEGAKLLEPLLPPRCAWIDSRITSRVGINLPTARPIGTGFVGAEYSRGTL